MHSREGPNPSEPKSLEGLEKRTTGQRDVELLEVGYWRVFRFYLV
jgi:hypothetical protein